MLGIHFSVDFFHFLKRRILIQFFFFSGRCSVCFWRCVFLVGVWFFTAVVESYFAQRKSLAKFVDKISNPQIRCKFYICKHNIYIYIYVFLLLGNWAFIFLHLEGFKKKTLPKNKQKNSFPLPHLPPNLPTISPPKKNTCPKRPWKNAWASSGKNSWPGIPGRHGPEGWRFFGWKDFPKKKISMLEEERYFSSTCMFECSVVGS